MEAPRDELREKKWNCSRCEVKGDKMCYQHIASYLFPVNRKNVSSEYRKIEESAQKTISGNGKENVIESEKFEEEEDEGRKIAAENGEEQVEGNEKEVEVKNCIPRVCENDIERNEKFAQKMISLRLKDFLKKSKKNVEGECMGKIPVGVRKGGGKERELDVSWKRKRCRKPAEKGNDLPRSSEGALVEEEEVIERKRLKCVQNEEEKGDEDGALIELWNQVKEGDGKGAKRRSKKRGKTKVEENDVDENGTKKKEVDAPLAVPRRFRKVARTSLGKKKPKSNDGIDDKNGIKIDLNTCHQCHRNDKGRVIRCTKCKMKRFCIPCITNWYPRMTEEQISLACPVCLGSCNCKACLRMDGRIKHQVKDGFKIGQDIKIDHSKYLLRTILPFLKQFNQEQIAEKEIEAKIQGILVSEVEIQHSTGRADELVFCNNCRNTIVDFHRSCPTCKYDLCLTCCQEVRNGQLQSCEEVIMEYADQGFKYLHGKNAPAQSKKPTKGYSIPAKKVGTARGKRSHAQSERKPVRKDAPAQSKRVIGGKAPVFDDQNKAKPEWEVNKNGAIPCPPSQYEGCGGAFLELKSILSDGWVSELLKKAEQAVAKCKHVNSPNAPEGCSCSASDVICGSISQKCASRDGSNDNYLYWPDARDIKHGDLKHFQWHWTLGEPIIVRDVLETTLGLSWEPMVMWRAFRQLGNSKHSTPSSVKAINCLDWSEVDLCIYQFFKGYSHGHFDSAKRKQPSILQLKDWPPNGKFEQRLPRHAAEFFRALPFKEYTHPRHGVLNLAAKWPLRTLKPDLGPKTYISYGRAQELGYGDSITMLHCDMSDVVNILVHTTEVSLRQEGANPSGSLEGSVHDNGGAVWDIFRREDVSKLQNYLRGHCLELRQSHFSTQKQVIHPIQDHTFYLTGEHKRKLKEEYGIEPWTFVQKLGEAVFIPAGCPHQVRNLKSCIKVALDFVSPENVHECIRMAGELRGLPRKHRAKEDTLEVWKMIIHAIKQAVNDLEIN